MTASTFFFFNAPATPEIYTLSLHDALPIYQPSAAQRASTALAEKWSCCTHATKGVAAASEIAARSEEHTSELQSQFHLVCRLLLEKKKTRRHNPKARILSPTT